MVELRDSPGREVAAQRDPGQPQAGNISANVGTGLINFGRSMTASAERGLAAISKAEERVRKAQERTVAKTNAINARRLKTANAASFDEVNQRIAAGEVDMEDREQVQAEILAQRQAKDARVGAFGGDDPLLTEQARADSDAQYQEWEAGVLMDHTLAVDARQTLNVKEDAGRLASRVLRGDQTLAGSDDEIEEILVSNGHLPGPKKDAAAREIQQTVAVGLVQTAIRSGTPQEAVDLMDSKEMLGRLGDQENGLRNAAQAAIEKKKKDAKERNNGGLIERAGTLAATLQQNGTPNETTIDILTALRDEADDEEVTAAIDSLIRTLPTPTEREAAIATAGLGADKVEVANLVDAGVPQQTARLVAAGGATVNIDLDPSRLTPKELGKIRGQVRTTRTARSALEEILPLINADTVGLFAALSAGPGGIAQQLPFIKTLANTRLGKAAGLDKASVDSVKLLRKKVTSSLGTIAEFIVSRAGKSQRLTNLQLNLARETIGITELSTDADVARKNVADLIEAARQQEEELLEELSFGRVEGEPDKDASEMTPEESEAAFQAILNPGQ